MKREVIISAFHEHNFAKASACISENTRCESVDFYFREKWGEAREVILQRDRLDCIFPQSALKNASDCDGVLAKIAEEVADFLEVVP